MRLHSSRILSLSLLLYTLDDIYIQYQYNDRCTCIFGGGGGRGGKGETKFYIPLALYTIFQSILRYNRYGHRRTALINNYFDMLLSLIFVCLETNHQASSRDCVTHSEPIDHTDSQLPCTGLG